MRIILSVIKGPNKGRSFGFVSRDRFIVGRSKHAHFRLPAKDRYFSRFHFVIEFNPPLCRLMDMGSRNGTFVNGQEIVSTDLKHGDRIKAGHTIFQVAFHQEAADTADPEAGSEQEAAGLGHVVPQAADPCEQAVQLIHGLPAPEAKAEYELAEVSAQELEEVAEAPVVLPADCCRVCLRRDYGYGQPQPFSSELASICSACQKEIREQSQPIADYIIVRKLGEGGMGVVWLALRRADGTPVAVKMITPRVTAESRDLQRFLREAEILRNLSHPNIVSFREMGEVDNRPYIAMDFVRGTDASRLVKAHGPLPIGRAVSLVCQLLEALEYAHAKDYVHRDIKPANLLVMQEGDREVVKVADFGLARIYQSSKLSGVTLHGDVGGTTAFMAPEQITNFRQAKPPVDHYGAGATLYNLLTNRFIYDFPPSPNLQMNMVLTEKPIPIQERRADIPDDLAVHIHRALARKPQDRFKNVVAMRKALLPFCSE